MNILNNDNKGSMELDKLLSNFDIEVSNLGPISNATIKLRSFTVIAGPNGSGKSFLTKFIYSFLKTLSINHMMVAVLEKRESLRSFMQELKITITPDDVDINDKESINYKYKALDILITNLEDFISTISEKVESFNAELSVFRGLHGTIERYQDDFWERFVDHLISKNTTDSLVYVDLIRKEMARLSDLLSNPEESFNDLMGNYLVNELLENFQVGSFEHFISKGGERKSAILDFKSLGSVSLSISDSDQSISVDLNGDKLNKFRKLNHVTYLESPVHWKLAKALREHDQTVKMRRLKTGRENQLSGVPKHFLDLNETISIDVKKSKDPLIDLSKKIHAQIQGKLGVTDRGDIFFYADKYKKLESGSGIPLTLTASGVVNLGVIQLLLEKEIITKNSYLFIDEPEVNLHPAWQRVLIEVLFDLSKAGVKVVITTHSLDIMKNVEYLLMKHEDSGEEHFGINQLSSAGKSINLDSSNLNKIADIQVDLGTPFNDMFIDIGLL